MAVDCADCLQVGVDNGGAYKGHAPPLQILGNGIREGRGSARSERFTDNLAFGEGLKIAVERAEFFLDFFKNKAVLNGGFDFESITDDGGVFHQFLLLLLAVCADLLKIKLIEGGTEGFALVEHAFPG